MGVSLQLQDQGSAAPRTGFQNVIAILGQAVAGDDNSPIQTSRDATLVDTFEDGPLVEEGGYIVRTGTIDAVFVKVESTIDGSLSAVDAHSGTSPTVTVDGEPNQSLSFKLVVTKGGARGTAQAQIAVDGETLGPTFEIPDVQGASLQGSADLSGITLSTLNTLTFKIDSDVGSEETVTFTTPSSVEDIATQINAQTTNEKVASIVSGRYLKISNTGGASSTLTVGNGTANTILGFTSTQSAQGSDADYEIPHTGVVATFASGTYVEGNFYTWTSTGPRFTTTELDAALDALRTSGIDFESVHLLYEPIDAADALVMATALVTKVGSWTADTPRKFVACFMGTKVCATAGDATSEQTNDNLTKAAFSTFNSQLNALVHGDIYIPGTNLAGLFRRQLNTAHAGRCARYRLSSDPGNKEQPPLESASMVGPDGVTKARDENTALVKMRNFRFTTAQDDGGAYISRGVTRASTPKFKHTGVMRMAFLSARLAYEAVRRYENADRTLAADGTLLPGDADAIEDAVFEQMKSGLLDSPLPTQSHASGVEVTIDRTEKVGSTDNLTVTWAVQHKAQIVTVTGVVGIVSELSLT